MQRFVGPVLIAALTACTPAEPGRVLQVLPAPDGELDDASLPVDGWFTTIQAAVDAASRNDTVSIPSGTYYEDVVINKGITFRGAGPGETIIVGSVSTGEGYTSIFIESMSIYSATWYAGGAAGVDAAGIYSEASSACTHSDLDIQGFHSGVHVDWGDGVYVGESTLSNNLYGVRAESVGQVRVYNSLFSSNAMAGIHITWASEYDSDVAYNTLVGNGFGASSTDTLTGAVAIGSSYNVRLQDNIIVSNAVGVDCDGCSYSPNNNLVWGNSTDYVNDASASSTDLSEDPLFLNSGEGDYHLSGLSPAIDAGVEPGIYVYTDFDGEGRPQGEGYDIGYDEYAVSATELIISEVMANPGVEDTSEFVEIYNPGSGAVDLAGLVLSDGDDADVLEAYGSSATTIGPGEYAMIIDAEYDGFYGLDRSINWLTTSDTNLGNGLTTSDSITLYESDGATIITSYSHPFDPGDSVSVERYDLEADDTAGNWRASQCAGGHSAGVAHCFPESGDATSLVITEIMNNALDEATGEFIEIYNPSATEIDLAGLYIYDEDSWDALVAWDGGSTLLGSLQHAVVIDPGWSSDFHLPAGTVLLTTSDASLCNGLSASTDPVHLYDADQATLIDSFTHLWDAGDGISWEKVDYAAGDVTGNWVRTTDSCSSTSSPGRLNAAAGGLCGALIITEVMANPDDEDSGEFIEIYNAGDDTVDLDGLSLSDGDTTDTTEAYDGGVTELAPGGYALILDVEYAGEYSIDGATVLLTTDDTTVGNALSTSDEVTLYEADSVHPIDAFLHPTNPGNGVSVERVSLTGIDDDSNWTACTCPGGSSPGLANCASETADTVSDLYGYLIVTEIMSNPLTESTGEFIELYNDGTTDVDLAGFILYDGDSADPLEGFTDPTDTVLPPMGFAVILDSGYAGEYSIVAGTLLLTTDDAALASGLAVDDPVYLFEPNGISLVDGYSWPLDAGDGFSVEKVDLLMGDRETNWDASACSSGSSPGDGPCFP
jgi:hypothetical protein